MKSNQSYQLIYFGHHSWYQKKKLLTDRWHYKHWKTYKTLFTIP